MKDKTFEILKKYWGYPTFREKQLEIIESILQKKDTLAMLPTGGGKSICFQVPALLFEGICLVISPLIALMEDQVKNLKNKNINAVCLTGNIPKSDVNRILNNAILGAYKFLYIAPERLKNTSIQEFIKQLNINLIAIDEAHCISHWGKDFRPAYLECNLLKSWFPTTPIIALTATATPKIQQDIIENLQLQKPNIIKQTLHRKNLAYMVYEVENKRSYLMQILNKNKESSIVYVRSRQLTLELSLFLSENGFSSAYYHGGLSTEEKKQQMNKWLNNKSQVMVATNAFGMGIDKPNVRTVIHWEIPASVEDYFQEAGRAGRDGKKAFAIVLYNQNDIQKLQKSTLQSFVSIDFLKYLYQKLCSYFHIAYQQGQNETFELNLSDFIQSYQLDIFSTYQGLQILERNQVISLNFVFNKKTEVTINVSSEEMRNYLKKNPNEKEILYYFMRSFTGIYKNSFSFKIEKLASILNKSISEIEQLLIHLQKNNIISYKTQKNDYTITFLVSRDDNRTINHFATNVHQFNQVKKIQSEAILNYITNNNQCREYLLLNYFSEKSTKNCGICSFCVEKKQKNKEISLETQQKIMDLIRKKPMNYKEICEFFRFSEQEIVSLLKIWVDTKKIKQNNFNQYTPYE